MPRDTLFSREHILNAAFDIFTTEGMSAISARRVAAALNCSTAPVYTAFSNMDELRALLVDKALELLLEYTEREYTPHAFLNIGVGMLEFARDYPLVYRTLFLESSAHQDILKQYTRRNLVQMKKDHGISVFDDDELPGILYKLTVYTHGLASLICAGMADHTSTDYFIANLRDVGGDIMCATALKGGKFETYMRREPYHEEDNGH